MSMAVIKDVFWYFASAISIQNRDSVLNVFLISLQMRTFRFNCIFRNMNIPRTLKIQSTLWTHKAISLRMNSQKEVQTANHKCSGKFKDCSFFLFLSRNREFAKLRSTKPRKTRDDSDTQTAHTLLHLMPADVHPSVWRNKCSTLQYTGSRSVSNRLPGV